MLVAEVPFDLVEAKLAAPFTRPDTVAKTDVIARLSSSSAPFACVTAPAGYGKTTLLARWAEADPRPFAWISLDGRDDDAAVVFLRYIAAAIHQVEPLPVGVFDALSGPGGSAQAIRVARLGGALASLKRPVVIVLDDLHSIRNQSCVDALAELAAYVPAGSQIAVTSRVEPNLPLARWRANGSVYEVGVADLRLVEAEAELLLEAAGVELDWEGVSELTAHTEGWPAGLYLAALSMQSGATSPAGPKVFAGDDRFVSDYFRLELLSRLPPAEARFLTHTSVLDRMCGELCDSVLETSGSAGMLESLARTNGFVVPLDRRGEWFRYHHLFGELLRNELEAGEPELVPELNARAMAWFLAAGRAEDAIVYGHAAGKTDTVAGLLDALALPLHYDGRMETLEAWLGWFNDEELTRYPALAVYGAWVRALTGRPDEAARLLALADGATSAIPLSDGSASIEPWVATLRAHMMNDGVEQALTLADRALSQLPSESIWVPVALIARGVAHALVGLTDRAIDDLTAVIERAPAFEAYEEMYVAHAQLALIAAEQGAWGEAAIRAQAAQAIVDEMGLGEYSTSALASAATARVALHEARYEDARTALTRAHRLRPQLDHAIPWVTVEVGIALTRVHLALRDAGAARTVLTETEHVLELRPDLGVLVDVVRELREHVNATAGPAGAWAMSLTRAELRLLPYLATHLSFPEIGSRLFLSRNTIKTEAVAVYRKLGVSSRSEAIERAIEVGLLESTVFPPVENLTLEV